jgi:DnaJ-domain-containing protein 1
MSSSCSSVKNFAAREAALDELQIKIMERLERLAIAVVERHERAQALAIERAAARRRVEEDEARRWLNYWFPGFDALVAPEQAFQVLGVGSDSSKDEIARAYKRLAAKHHPDRGGDTQTMARINAARDALL